MTSFLVRRAGTLLTTLWLVSLVTFLVLRVLPGDAAQLIIGPDGDPAAVERVRAQLGMDRPVWQQYVDWIGNAVQGDLGESIRYKRPVAGLIWDRLRITLPLTLMATALAVAISVPLGIAAAVRRNRPTDYIGTMFSQIGLSIPDFWAGIMLIMLFAVNLRWLPSSGFPGWQAGWGPALAALLLPAVALALARMAILTRMVRSAMLETLAQDYVRTARSKGVAERAVIYRHALRNALIPPLTILGLQVGQLLAGSVVIETVFTLPGIGHLLITSIGQRDVPSIQGLILFIAFVIVATNFLVDMIYAWVDPRIRY